MESSNKALARARFQQQRCARRDPLPSPPGPAPSRNRLNLVESLHLAGVPPSATVAVAANPRSYRKFARLLTEEQATTLAGAIATSPHTTQESR